METRKQTSSTFRDIVVPVGSLFVAMAGILLGYYSQTTQIRLAEYAITFKTKQLGYGRTMSELHKAFYNGAGPRQLQSMKTHLSQAWAEYYLVKPFVAESGRGKISTVLSQLDNLCEQTYAGKLELVDAEERFHSLHGTLGDMLEVGLGLQLLNMDRELIQ